MYKRVLQPIVFVLLMAVVYGCNQKAQTPLPSPSQNDSTSVAVNEQEDGQKDGKLNYKKVEQSKKDKSGEYKIVVDFPTGGNPILVNAIREYISESLGISYAGEMENNMQGSYSGDLGDGQKMIDYYFDLKYKEFKNAHDEMAEHMQGDTPTFASETEIHYLYETDKFVTYEMKKYEDMGGAHGGTFISGMTFRKSDGRRVDWELFTRSMQDVIKKGLKKYFEANTDEEMENFLSLENTYLLPLPATPPVFTKEGVLFTYQQYEIAAYAAGLPSFIVPYDEAKLLMNTTGKNLLP
ncbi:MAG: DUF3298 domain-containing protein [Prevotella sp.]|nr:DUF3298 domain-containing protein [Prevotella sp.]